jgi:RNA processing factor Prp31
MDIIEEDIDVSVTRVYDWYGLHFPELATIAKHDFIRYAKTVLLLMTKSNATTKMIPHLSTMTDDTNYANMVIDLAKISFGEELSYSDIFAIVEKLKNFLRLIDYRERLYYYLKNTMKTIAPNLSALIGFNMGSRLVNHFGSLFRIAKEPTSFWHFFRVEKMFPLSLKTKSVSHQIEYILPFSRSRKTRKRLTNRVSRYIAHKCSLAARIDFCLEGFMSAVFGAKLKEQIRRQHK